MIAIEDLYFDWLMTRIDQEGVTEGLEYLCTLLHNCEFQRRVGNDMNRAEDGINLRKEFLEQFAEADMSPHVTNRFMEYECSWLEMLISLARSLDYLYDGGTDARFIELISNMELGYLATFNPRRTVESIQRDQWAVEAVTSNIDGNRFDRDGVGGLFPLRKGGHPDQRTVEIWDQHAAYFREKLEGVLFS